MWTRIRLERLRHYWTDTTPHTTLVIQPYLATPVHPVTNLVVLDFIPDSFISHTVGDLGVWEQKVQKVHIHEGKVHIHEGTKIETK